MGTGSRLGSRELRGREWVGAFPVALATEAEHLGALNGLYLKAHGNISQWAFEIAKTIA